MTITRYYITAGASTTAGGTVNATSQYHTVDGAALAREGDPVDCAACGTQGRIECVSPRLSDSCGGREYALSDDLCICQCSPPPRLVACQYTKYQLIG
jgi:uncharacterized Zn-binding protein involved in type VI secretion